MPLPKNPQNIGNIINIYNLDSFPNEQRLKHTNNGVSFEWAYDLLLNFIFGDLWGGALNTKINYKYFVPLPV